MALNDRAMLVSLHIEVWSAIKQDKKAALDAAQQYQASAKAIRVMKSLIDKGKLDKINAVAGKARGVFRKYCLPYLYDGTGIMSNEVYFDCMSELQGCKIEFEDAREVIRDDYTDMVDEAKTSLLGSLWNHRDYPSQAAIEAKFQFSYKVMPIPDSSQWGDLIGDADENEKVIRDIDDTLISVEREAMKELWSRLFDVVNKMAVTLREYTGSRDGSFRDTLIFNVRDLSALLPKLNVSNDPQLNAMADAVSKTLCTYSADELRKSDSARKVVVTLAEGILEAMPGK